MFHEVASAIRSRTHWGAEMAPLSPISANATDPPSGGDHGRLYTSSCGSRGILTNDRKTDSFPALSHESHDRSKPRAHQAGCHRIGPRSDRLAGVVPGHHLAHKPPDGQQTSRRGRHPIYQGRPQRQRHGRRPHHHQARQAVTPSPDRTSRHRCQSNNRDGGTITCAQVPSRQSSGRPAGRRCRDNSKTNPEDQEAGHQDGQVNSRTRRLALPRHNSRAQVGQPGGPSLDSPPVRDVAEDRRPAWLPRSSGPVRPNKPCRRHRGQPIPPRPCAA